MAFVLLAVAVGVALGVVAGGSVRNIAATPLRLPGLLVAGVVAQLASAFGGYPVSLALMIAGYTLLVAFAAANLHMVGVGLVLVGASLNLLVVAANGGMPVRAEAAVAAGIADWPEVESVDFGPRHHLERPDDRFRVLADIIPVPGTREVLSFGDLVLGIGAADVAAHLVRARRPRRNLFPAVQRRLPQPH